MDFKYGIVNKQIRKNTILVLGNSKDCYNRNTPFILPYISVVKITNVLRIPSRISNAYTSLAICNQCKRRIFKSVVKIEPK